MTTLDHILELTGPAVLLPIPKGKKGPTRTGWQTLSLGDMTTEHLAGLNHGNNIGVLLGEASQGLCTIDCDAQEGLDTLLELNPSLAATLQSRGARGGNLWLRITGSFPKSCKLMVADGSAFGEWRADGNQTVIHGTHPSGCVYKRNDKPVLEVSFDSILWPEGMRLPWIKPEPAQAPASYTPNDAGRATRFVDRFARDIRFVHDRSLWMTWTDNRWRPDRDGSVLRLAVKLSGEMLAAAALITGTSKADQQAREQAAQEALACGDRRNIQDFLELAKVDIRILLASDKLDADLWTVAAQNAVVDLKTGIARDFTRSDFTTRELGTPADPQAECPRWIKFMEEVFPDESVRNFVHKAAGYTLTGDTREQVFFFAFGTGRNGKSKFVEALEHVMGTYGVRAGKGIVAANGRGDFPKGEVAELAGARLACASETGEGERMNEELVKDLTGSDFMRGEHKYERGFRFKPVCKLWICGNHKPTIRGTDGGIWRRVRLIPFLQTFEGTADDRNLSAKLAAEAPGILNWLIQGCQLWRDEGLEAPDPIRQAVDSYRTEEDTLADFIGECVTEDVDANTSHADLFRSYQFFCGESGIRFPLTAKLLAKKLRERGWRDVRTASSFCFWRAVGLRRSE